MKKGTLTKEIIEVAGRQRSFLYYIPTSYDEKHELPLLLSFHGATSSGEHHSRLTNFHRLAEEEQFFVLYPESTQANPRDPSSKQWNEGVEDNPVYQANVDDVLFVQTLIVYWQQICHVDPQRVYTTGFSNGSSFSLRLAIELPNTFAAIGSVAGPLPKHLIENVKSVPPLIFIMGNSDPIVPFSEADAAGERTFSTTSLIGAKKTAETFAYRSSHAPEIKKERMKPRELNDPTRIEQTCYLDKDKRPLVMFYHVKGGGHTWPGGPKVQSPTSNGKVSQQMDASQWIWETFKEWANHE
ncbi:polyhydroxybutyrate depolymerase [Geomicrobium halophilum]|uniref:Polyhydroxybutyrate depolymerase n=1 Tax=Geomicrobium halophilum TaxID=549000 RepID=A0A841PU87_9BACL|nr:PHB depolymerase family esterase [Geomicrobium halophilum]MBB6451324.1 polyhydroxybutyrate depolymerase [Geomicrobium halophilum]